MTNRVLFVDDDELILRSLSRHYHYDFDLTIAYSAEEARTLINGLAEFDVVVTDIRMPGEDGLDLINSVAGSHPGTRFIVLTGNADLATIQRAGENPYISSVLRKPSTFEEISEAIEFALTGENIASRTYR